MVTIRSTTYTASKFNLNMRATALKNANAEKVATEKQKYTGPDTSLIKDNLSSIIKDAGKIIDGIKTDLDTQNQTRMEEVSKNLKARFGISGVDFEENDYKNTQGVLSSARGAISSSLNNNLVDYVTEANIASAKNIVEKYAARNHSKEQAEAITDALNKFIDNSRSYTSNLLSNKKMDSDSYYTSVKIDSPEELEKRIASNNELIEKIKNLFSGAALSNPDIMNEAIEEYKKLVQPAHEEITENTTEAEDAVNDEASKLKENIENILKAVEGGQDVSITA